MTTQKKKYDVGILGWWYGKNYGSILTYYGLNRAIETLGFRVLMVHETLGYNGYRVKWPEDILSMQFARRVGYKYTEQRHYSKMTLLNEEVGTFVVGSDQLWNPLIGRVNDDLFLDFVSPENRRVAYATSFGNRGIEKFKPEFVEKHSANLKAFSGISVRESYAAATAKEVFGVEATQVVDPVFLLPTETYLALAEQATTKVSGDYLAVFYLDPTPQKRDVALALADKLGFKRIVVIPNPDGGRKLTEELFVGERFEILGEDTPENFLHSYSKAGYVVTDSFHGSAFAVIFQKPFSSIYNTHRGADRFASLMGALGFGETRRIYETNTAQMIQDNPNVSRTINFTAASAYIEAERKASLAWLKTALSSAPRNVLTRQTGRIKRLAARVRALIPLRAKKSAAEPVGFAANNGSWNIKDSKGRTQLSVVSGAGERGNLVWTTFPKDFEKSKTYRLKLVWQVRTASSIVTVNIRNRKTGEFVPVSQVVIGEKRNVQREDIQEFSPTKDGFGQIMFGASQFTGDNPGIEIIECSVTEVKKSVLPKSLQKDELALPTTTRTIKQVCDSVAKDPTVKTWLATLVAAVPGLEIHLGKLMKDYTYNKVGGPADLIALPETTDEMTRLLAVASAHKIPVTVLGLCTNLLVRDGGIRGLVIFTTKLRTLKLEDGYLIAGAGAGLTDAAFFLMEHSKACLEWAAGIPGTVGGAVYMNAGTNISDIRRCISRVTMCDGKGQIRSLSVSDIAWGKRYSTFQDNRDWIVLEAAFKVADGDKEALRQSMMQTIRKRESHFPLHLPNHGSTFKWWRAPRLIAQTGLVGVRIGGAQISTKQPGFFVNVHNATASDYEALINLTIAKVYELSNFLMEPEVEILGERLHRYERYTVQTVSDNLDQR